LLRSGMANDIRASRIWKVVLAYDGTEFHGWQVQPGLATIQGELRAAIERVTGEDVLPQGSGRTDAGVHAEGQVASFALCAPIPEANLVRALNRTLPPCIRVLTAHHAEPDFHARHAARAKTYEYRLYRGEICPPSLARYVYAINHPLDLAAMQRAACHLLGEHDFTSFAATDPDLAERAVSSGSEVSASTSEPGTEPFGNLRTIYASHWIGVTTGSAAADLAPGATIPAFCPTGLEILTYRVRGSGFLHHMVRNLVGTLLEVGRGNLREDAIPQILKARNRACAGPTAPARGLFLCDVEY
jgi:tRNA pseudouridine38-40 synthase